VSGDDSAAKRYPLVPLATSNHHNTIAPVSGEEQARRDWENAMRKAERSGDLTEIATLIRSNAHQGFFPDKLAELFDDHRLVRKKRGNWKSIFEPSAQEKYAEAAEWVRLFDKRKLIKAYYDDIDDPIAYVAQKLGLNAEKLQSFMQGRFGFGRGRKPKPKSGGPASKCG
jgi:hypothetical protein